MTLFSKTSMTYEEIKKAKKDLIIIEKLYELEKKVDDIKTIITNAKTQGIDEEFLILQKYEKILVKYQKDIDYFTKYMKIYSYIESERILQEKLIKEKRDIESEIHLRYAKIIECEILEKTRKLKEEIKQYDDRISTVMLKSEDCLHCDETNNAFSSICKMCGYRYLYGH